MTLLINVLTIIKDNAVMLAAIVIVLLCIRMDGLSNQLKESESKCEQLTVRLDSALRDVQRFMAISSELANALSVVELNKQTLNGQIDHAVKNDSPVFTGIGADSLCLYRKAFGYECSNSGIHENTNQTRATEKRAP